MTQDTASNGQPQQTQALTPYQARMVELREDIGQDYSPRAIVPRTFAEAQSFAAAIAQSTLVPEALRNRAPDVLMMVLAGAELEIPPVRSLSLFHVIEGVPKLSADGLAGKVTSSPLCDYLEPIEQSDTRVTWRGRRRGRAELTLSYTFAEAERAGLTGPTRSGRPSNWMKHPTDMLNARCKSRLCRLLWPDLCAGLVTAEEALDVLAAGEPGPSSTFSAPPPVPTTPAAAPAKSSKPRETKAATKPIDTTATESTSTSTPSSTPSANTNAAAPAPASTTSSNTSTASPNESSTASSRSSSADTSPDVPASSSPATESQPSAPVEDSSGFGDDEAPAMTIERFEAELAAAVATKTPPHCRPSKRTGFRGPRTKPRRAESSTRIACAAHSQRRNRT